MTPIIETLSNNDIEKFRYEINKKGYTVIRRLFSLNFLKKLERAVLKKSWSDIHNDDLNVLIDASKCSLSSSHNLVNHIDYFKSLYESEKIKSFYKDLMGTKCDQEKKINSSYFFKQKISGNIKLHQDNAYFNLVNGLDALTFYVPVHYQSRAIGTIFYYEGSHQLGDLKHVPEGNIGASMCLEKNKSLKKLSKYKIDYLELEPGDCVLHNALVVHGTLPNPKNILCEAFNFTLFNDNNLINKKSYNVYREKLKIFLENKKKSNKSSFKLNKN